MNAPQQPRTYCYDERAKVRHSQAMRRFYRAALKELNSTPNTPEFAFKVHFKPGGIAVWGETYAYISEHSYAGVHSVIEAYDTSMGLLVRQWDGHNSGRNHYVQTLEQFVSLVRDLASKPFVRF